MTYRDGEQITHWRPGDGNDPPCSAGRITLFEAYTRFCQAQTLFWEGFVERLTSDSGHVVSPETVQRSRILGNAILRQRIQSWTRPIGGGPVERLGPAQWEVDDFSPRFKKSTLNLPGWADHGAVPTHHVFVDEAGLERFIADWLAEQGAEDERHVMPPTGHRDIARLHQSAIGDPTLSAPALDVATFTTRKLIRMPEVKRQTSLSRSGVYERMKLGTFPQSHKLGPRTSAWYEDDVSAWVRAQCN